MPTMPTIEDQRKTPFVPKISSSVHKISETNNDIFIMQEHFEDESRTTGSRCNKNNRNDNPPDCENYDDDENRYNALNAKLSKCLQLLGALTVDMKGLKQCVAVNNRGNAYDINSETALQMKKDLPLKSREEVNAFEKKLSNSQDYRQEFVRFINQIGGANGKDYTERVLNAIFSQSFATDNTWEGKVTKFKINKLNLITICEEIILKKFSYWDSVEFAKAGINWFRLGNQRAGKQPKQVEKKPKPPNNSNTKQEEY
ncbi:PREDICTED: uncharacterized protein LOC107073679 [Polistes dominula]|uniref:Uncharacterized protein LOC107073679 n=1 Tax=Polistes dominula TaxID=743375 RepID=A0ABM1JBL8_POLDO|nr:PREDICTED: uncharacterized protein LOC107073679 [Polistes dominula]